MAPRRARRAGPLLLVAAALGASCGGGGDDADAGRDAGPPVCPEVRPGPAAGRCVSDADCAAGASCRLAAGATVDLGEAVLVCAAPAPGAPSGAACATSADCASGLCAWAGTCLAPCGTSADCAGDEAARCRELPVRGADDGSVRARVCVPRFALAPGVDTTAERRAAALEGGGEVEELPVPPLGALGLAVFEDLCGGRPRPATLLTSRPRRLLFDADRAGIGEAPFPNPVEAALPIVVHVPASPEVQPSAAGYALGVRAELPADVDVATLVWSPPAAGAARELDLDLFYVGPAGLAPEGERGPRAIADALAAAELLLAPARIELGAIRQHLVTGALADELAVIDVEPGGVYLELERLFALSGGARGPGLAVFFVRGLERGELGLAGGIPTPLGMPGTAGSGLAIAYDLLVGAAPGDVDLGRALAHEIGHALGLFHTTEAVGLVLDPLPDTPICPVELDGSGGTPADGLLDARECTGFGSENLMFHSASGVAVSADQAAILARAPVALTPR